MRSFEESLERVLDPDHYLWLMIGSADNDAGRKREVEVRLDVPSDKAGSAIRGMEAAGWNLSSRPDEGTDPLERVFWRRTTAVHPGDVKTLLTDALKVAHDSAGTLVSWINVEDLEA